MKRSQSIQQEFMRKRRWQFVVKPMTVAIAAIAAGCSSNREEATFVQSVSDCVDRTAMNVEQCTYAYEQALSEARRTGPKYQHKSHCETDFGIEQCYQAPNNIWTPLISGFLVGYIANQALNSNREIDIDFYGGGYKKRRYNPVYRYDSYVGGNYNKLMTADGTIIGKHGQSTYKVPKKTLTQKMPSSKKTISRGGFGSVASAKSSWGGGKSSRSWGG
ncbi:DUF1190 domain-containing protein [Marinibactrum halimedae]|uniref:UPF0441 protein n=1 Tax=Marinibactrum halimedae TaxID=1444977 RepID=A0AA37T9B0_9GAMM|nr:DUF1190 domain-containing protein [Marinibactrum halimedae]MCD9459167.1 DUF1190 domain-containing protein [Marinibactrum halimedae]GLS27238.1 UPF0441 protein [Marinibactrum halimedae]